METAKWNGVAYELLGVEYVAKPKLWVGDYGAGRLLVWSQSAKRLVQALDTAGGGEVAELDDRGAVIVGMPPDLSDFDEMFEQPTRSVLYAYDLVTGVVRWRRHERKAGVVRCGTANGRAVVKMSVGTGAIVLDAATGIRVRIAANDFVERPKPRRPARWPFPGLAPAEMPGIVRRHAMKGLSLGEWQRVVDDAARACLYGPDAPAPAWSDGEAAADVVTCLRQLCAFEGRPLPGDLKRFPSLALPPDIRAIYSTQSAWLKARWRIDPAALPALQAEAAARGAPRAVTAFGRLADDTLLCAQPTALGCRIGLYNKGIYKGPFPVTTGLSEATWALAESRGSKDDADDVCRRMSGLTAPPDPGGLDPLP